MLKHQHLEAVVLALCVWGAYVWGDGEAAKDPATIQEQLEDRKRDLLAPTHRHSLERREIRTSRRRRPTLYQFQEQDGSLTFTNRPERYWHNRDYEEIEIRYEPIVVPAPYRNFSSPKDYSDETVQAIIREYALKHRLDEDLVYAVIKVESNFNANAVSKKGARGLMQLMPGTAAEMGVERIFDPAQNIAGGTQYLMKLLELFEGDRRLALAAYNAGPTTVKEHKGIPPFPETRGYVRDVLAWTKRFKEGGAPIKAGELRRLHLSESERQEIEIQPKRYIVHFHSGLTQPADRVVDKPPYYYIEYGKRTYPVPKKLVAKIQEPA